MVGLQDMYRAWRRSLVERQAAAWIARLQSDKCTDDDRKRFAAWIGRSNAHDVAFSEASAAWDELLLVPGTGRALPSRTTIDATPRLSRRQLTAAVGGTVIFGGGGVLAWTAASAKTFSTQIGETRHVNLGNGLELDLDALTQVRVNGTATHVDVEHGRVRVRVSHQTTVRAGNCTLATPSALFDVECREGRLKSLLLLNGVCLLDTEADTERRLEAPSLLDGDKMTLSRPEGIMLDQLTAWHEGRAIFDNERLVDAIALMNRYDQIQLRLRDASLVDLQISGTFRLGDNRKFAEALEELLPVSTRPQGLDIILRKFSPA